MGNFANIFTQLRKERGYTQETLAKALGISRSTVGMYESGKRTPDSEDLEKLADFFNVDVDYLLGRSTMSTYYINPETAKKAQELFDDPNLRVLFDAARDARPEDLQKAADYLKAVKAMQLGLDNEGV